MYDSVFSQKCRGASGYPGQFSLYNQQKYWQLCSRFSLRPWRPRGRSPSRAGLEPQIWQEIAGRVQHHHDVGQVLDPVQPGRPLGHDGEAVLAEPVDGLVDVWDQLPDVANQVHEHDVERDPRQVRLLRGGRGRTPAMPD